MLYNMIIDNEILLKANWSKYFLKILYTKRSQEVDESYINDSCENILILGKWANLGPKLTCSYASGFCQLKEFFLNLCTKKAKRYMKLLLLVLPKKFLFAANRTNLGPKMLVVGTLDPISRNYLSLAVWRYSRSTPKICCWILEKEF